MRATAWTCGSSDWTTGASPVARRLTQRLLNRRDGVRPPAGAEFVGDDLAVLDDEETRRAGLARDLGQDGRELARPEVLLVGFPQLGRIDLDVAHALGEVRRQPFG